MMLRKATSKIPESLFDIEAGVLYVGEHEYPLNGLYRFWCTGRIKLGQRMLTEGYYTGTSTEVITVPKGSAICFDRFPVPDKEIITPPSVPEVVQLDDMAQRIDYLVEKRLEVMEETSDEELLIDAINDGEIDDIDSYVSPMGLVNIDLDEDGYPMRYGETSLSTEESKESESDTENTRVGGAAEPRGETSVSKEDTAQEAQV